MGKYRFRLSDMIPNSWFYKLKDMSRPTTTATTKHPSKRFLNSPRPTPPPPTKTQLYTPNRPSYYIASEHLEPPRKSKKKHRRSSGGSSSSSKKPVTNPTNSSSSSASTFENDDITIDIKSLSLHPIHTKPAERKDVELDSKQTMLRRQALHRIRVRPATPKIDVKRGRRRLEESLVIVKRSGDPKGDFRASMVEMIVENDIRGAKEMEELLACYLSLNSDVYHDLIVQVFEEIWVDLAAAEM